MKKTVYALGLLALTTVTSCTDNTYDLSKDNVDWSMQTSGDVLWLPDGSTANAMLKDLFSVSEGQNLKFIKDPETGRDFYCMQGDGEQDATVTMPAATATWSGAVTIDETSTTVDLSNIPGFLRNEKTCFDIENPVIFIKVDKSAGVDFKSFIALTNVKDGSETLKAITRNIEEFKVEGDCSGEMARTFYIAAEEVDDEDKDEWPEEYRGATWVGLDDSKSTLQQMLREMPDEFKIELQGYEGKGSGSVSLNVEYLFYAPMRPDNLFRLNDDDRADGFKSDLKNVLFEGMAVRADVVGDMPMTVRLEPVAINENGEVLNDVKLTIDGKSFVEVPGDDRTTILVTLTATGGKRVSDFVNRDVNYFDGIRFDFTLLKPTQPGAKIFSDMKVRLEDMKMGIIGAGYDGN
jgi:hypothetical protein